jgi:hypothetical protein
MPIDDVAIWVSEVLSRAGSLFAAPADRAGAATGPGPIGDAAQATRAIATRTAGLSGAWATAHGETTAAGADRLEEAAAAETALARHLDHAAITHHSGRSDATRLRVGTTDVPGAFGPAIHIPAGEVAALKALRNRVARMRELLAHHSAESARLAGEIRNLGFRG